MNTDILRGTLRADAAVSASLRYVDYVGGADTQPYEGEYTVTPALDEQRMATKGRVMTDNVTIREIPIDTVTNAAGGNTIIIG